MGRRERYIPPAFRIMKTKHTPGPWDYARPEYPSSEYLHEYRITAKHPDRPGCRFSLARVDEFTAEASEANARLIAAAPDLLAVAWALVQAASCTPQMDGATIIHGWDRKRLDAAFALARATISKAEGVS